MLMVLLLLLLLGLSLPLPLLLELLEMTVLHGRLEVLLLTWLRVALGLRCDGVQASYGDASALSILLYLHMMSDDGDGRRKRRSLPLRRNGGWLFLFLPSTRQHILHTDAMLDASP